MRNNHWVRLWLWHQEKKVREWVIQPTDLFCSAQAPPLGAEIPLEITGSGIVPANERWGVLKICFETLDPWGSVAAEVLLDLKQE